MNVKQKGRDYLLSANKWKEQHFTKC